MPDQLIGCMSWTFDQAPNVACVTNHAVIGGAPILVVTHYLDDHSWGFLDGQPFEAADALIVAMSTVVGLHPDVLDVADLPPGWSAVRDSAGTPWSKHLDEPDQND
jgi:hypothetical protein